ncbi:MAG TPA: endonuclease/exonuclease/phosphatase family protein, partial [Pseudonocardiaceae bacterium]
FRLRRHDEVVSRAREAMLAVLVAAVAAGAWVVSCSRPGLRPAGCLHGCAVGQRPPGPLRIVGLNVLHGFPTFAGLGRRVGLIAEEIRRLDADVVLLEEVPWTVGTGSVADELARRTGMNHLFLRANGNRRAILFEEGEEILSRFPLRDPVSARLPGRTGWFEHRVALAATVDSPWGPIGVVVAHLSGWPPSVSAAQVAALRRFVGDPRHPVVVGGDFNATDDSGPVRDLGQVWTDVLRSANPPDVGPTCCVQNLTSRPGATLRERIDYLWLVGAGAHVAQARRILTEPLWVGGGWLRASDHAGLFAAIDLGR